MDAKLIELRSQLIHPLSIQLLVVIFNLNNILLEVFTRLFIYVNWVNKYLNCLFVLVGITLIKYILCYILYFLFITLKFKPCSEFWLAEFFQRNWISIQILSTWCAEKSITWFREICGLSLTAATNWCQIERSAFNSRFNNWLHFNLW